jgi:hypothetical protein
MSRPLFSLPGGTAPLPRLQVEYAHAAAPSALMADDTLAVFGFGDAAPRSDDPRYLRVPLQPYAAAADAHGQHFEIWHANAPVAHGREPAPAQAGGDHYRLDLSAKAFARAVWIDFGELDATVQDNALTLAPGETVSLRVDASASLAELRKALRVRSLADTLSSDQ